MKESLILRDLWGRWLVEPVGCLILAGLVVLGAGRAGNSAMAAEPEVLTAQACGQATMSVSAPGLPTYQWFFEGAEIPGETSNILVLSNVQLSDAGVYSVRVLFLNGSSATNSFLLVVEDPDPVIENCPGMIVANAFPGTNAAPAYWNHPRFFDNCEGMTVTVTNFPGNLFQWGRTAITYLATDSGGNTNTCSFDIWVVDPNEAPRLLNPRLRGDDGFVFELFGQMNLAYQVQYTDRLVPSDWRSLTNFLGTGTLVTVLDDEVGDSSTRFYRAICSGPNLTAAYVRTNDLSTVILEFNQALDLASSTVTDHYRVLSAVGGPTELAVTNASVSGDGLTVTLTIAGQVRPREAIVTVEGVLAQAGLVMNQTTRWLTDAP